MSALEETAQKNHNVIIEDRKKFTLSGVKEVLAFDDESIALETVMGKLYIKGAGLHILSFESEIGDLAGEGRLHAVIYTAEEPNGGFFHRLFR